MKPISKPLAELNLALLRRMASHPPAKNELLDFHLKHSADEYIKALKAFSGNKLLIGANDGAEASRLIRRAAIVADVVVLRVASHLCNPSLSLVPIEDDLASPVLGLASAIDSTTGKERVANPSEYLYGMGVLAATQPAGPATLEMLGRPFDSTLEPTWHATTFSRTSRAFKNALGEACHLAGGAIHVRVPQADLFLEDAKPFLRTGQLVYAPFVSLPSDSRNIAETALKADLIGGHGGAIGATLGSDSETDLLMNLQFPYLENVRTDLLSKILQDEFASVASFRRELGRLLQDIRLANTGAEELKRMVKFRREVLEDELEKVRKTMERVSRLNAVARVGAYVGTGALAISAFFGVNAAAAITGGAGIAASTLLGLWRNREDAQDARRSSMHLFWRIGSAK